MDKYFVLRLNKHDFVFNIRHVVLVVKYDSYTEFSLDSGENYKVRDEDGDIYKKYFDLVGDPVVLG